MALVKCPRCRGRGRLSWDDGNPVGASILGLILDEFKPRKEICPLCEGKGYVDDGTIKVKGKYEIDVDWDE